MSELREPASPPPQRRPKRGRPLRFLLGIASVVAAVAIVLGVEASRTGATRQAVQSYHALIVAANQQDLDAARDLCTERYLREQPLTPAAEGGLIGLPRNVPHPNFQVWRSGSDVLLCPANRVGQVYRFVRERGAWRFDGLAGYLGHDGQVRPLVAGPDEPS